MNQTQQNEYNVIAIGGNNGIIVEPQSGSKINDENKKDKKK